MKKPFYLIIPVLLLFFKFAYCQENIPDWTINPPDFGFDGEIIANVFLNGVENTSGGILGAFVNGDCRGFKEDGLAGPTGSYVYILRAYSNNATGDTLSFKFYDTVTDRVYDIEETIPFISNMIEGNALFPVTLNCILTLNTIETLNDLLIDGSTISGFDPDTLNYSVVLPFGTDTIPLITAVAEDPAANVNIIPTTVLPGVTTVTVTAEDGITTRQYNVYFILSNPSNDASLETLTVDTVLINGFTPLIHIYSYNLPHETTIIPLIDASPTSDDATVLINQANGLPGFASVLVTAQDGITTKIYTVNFILLPSTDASLQSITIDSVELNGFSPDIYTYQAGLLTDKIEIPVIDFTTMDENASAELFTDIDRETSEEIISIHAIIMVTAEDNNTKLIYHLFFSIINSIDNSEINKFVLNTFPNPFSEIINISFNINKYIRIIITLNDIYGRKLIQIQDKFYQAGSHVIELVENNLPSGIYLVKVETDDFIEYRKVMKMK